MTSEIYKGHKSILILVVAKSGRGKSYSIRDLPPETTAIINVMGKPLPFMGAMQHYKVGENLFVTPEATLILDAMQKVSGNPKFDHLVIDDTQYIMATEFMNKVMVKGYDKFSIMARNIWDIMTKASLLRDGLKVFILTHEEDTGTERKMKTLGKLLDEKITPEGLSTIVLYGDVSGQEQRTYLFQTQSDGICGAKSPVGMFPLYMPNDLWLVSQRMDEYYGGVPLEESKLDFGNISPTKVAK